MRNKVELIEFLRGLEYVSGSEIKDFLAGHTSLEVLLTPEDLEKAETILGK